MTDESYDGRIITFTVPGMPHGKERARTWYDNRRHGYVSVTPDKTRAYEQTVGMAYHAAGGVDMGERMIYIMLTAYYPIPQRTSQANREKMIRKLIRPQRAPDADNIAKSICDGLNGVAYHDDRQIVSLLVDKLYTDKEPRVEVSVWGE